MILGWLCNSPPVMPLVSPKRVAFSGAHDATIAAVAAGKVDAGALNISVWEKLVHDGKIKPDQLKLLLDIEIQSMETEEHEPVDVLSKVADAMPGFGIVAAAAP